MEAMNHLAISRLLLVAPRVVAAPKTFCLLVSALDVPPVGVDDGEGVTDDEGVGVGEG